MKMTKSFEKMNLFCMSTKDHKWIRQKRFFYSNVFQPSKKVQDPSGFGSFHCSSKTCIVHRVYNWGVAILLRYWRIGTYFLRNIVSLIFSFMYFHNIESKNWSKINRATRIFTMNRRNLPNVVRFFVIIIVVIKVYRLF